MTKCETRKQLSYSRLGAGISQENGGSNLPLVWQSLIVTSYWQIGGGELNVTSRENPVVKECPESETQDHPVWYANRQVYEEYKRKT